MLKNLHLVYFSATYTTRKVLRSMAQAINLNTVEHDITNHLPEEDIVLNADSDIAIIGAPVYMGRVPGQVAMAMDKVNARGVPAILVCVYGNRAYEDALIELSDLALQQQMKPLGAAAFIGRHCIFPMVASDRPDQTDLDQADSFARQCVDKLTRSGSAALLPELSVPGNRPYRPTGPAHMHPTCLESRCTRCGRCAQLCPYGAISKGDLTHTDAARCMACGRCTVICPQMARQFAGEQYDMFAQKFAAANAHRQEPELFI